MIWQFLNNLFKRQKRVEVKPTVTEEISVNTKQQPEPTLQEQCGVRIVETQEYTRVQGEIECKERDLSTLRENLSRLNGKDGVEAELERRSLRIQISQFEAFLRNDDIIRKGIQLPYNLEIRGRFFLEDSAEQPSVKFGEIIHDCEEIYRTKWMPDEYDKFHRPWKLRVVVVREEKPVLICFERRVAFTTVFNAAAYKDYPDKVVAFTPPSIAWTTDSLMQFSGEELEAVKRFQETHKSSLGGA